MWVQSDQIVDSEFFKYRLFGSGLQGQIFEVNLHTMCVENQSDSYGGPVWMMDKNSNNSTVACACEDGSIRLFDLSSERIVYLLLNQYKGESTIIWCIRFIASTRHASLVRSDS